MAMRMSGRVYAGVAGLGLACVAASLVGGYFVRSIVASNEDVSSHLIPVLGALLDAQQGFGAIRLSTTRALVVTAAGRVEEVEPLWAERERALKEAEVGLASFARHPMNAEEAALWTQVRPAFSEFVVENGRVWNAIRSGDLAQAEELKETIARQFATQLLTPFEDLVEFQKKHAVGAAVQASSASALATRLLMAIMVTTVVAAVAIGWSLVRSESELVASEEKLRLALDSAQMGAWDWNLSKGDFRWTERCAEIVGLRPGDTASYEIFLRSLHENDRERVDRSLRDALAAKTDFDAEMRVLAADGALRWVAVKGRASYDAQGQAVRMSGVVQDITEAHQRTDELREALAHVKTLSGLLPICIYCKKIRDDQGYWERIESYIATHTDAFFSHGMCPECFEEHYGV